MNPKPSDCIFCKILANEIDSDQVFEDSISYAFLDNRPLFPGHVLLIPREHYGTLAELPASLIQQFFLNVQLLARAVESALDAEGTFVAINNRVSQSVPHLHVHIVPRRKKDGLKGFFWPRNRYKDEASLEQIRQSVRSAVDKLLRRHQSPAII